MALTAANVVVGVTGAVYAGPLATAAPTSASSALNVSFKDLGYVSEDGVSITTDKSSTAIRGWQNAALLRQVVTEGTLTYSFTLLETKQETIEAYFGGTMTAGKITIDPAATGGKKSFVIDIVDGAKSIRHYIPAGEILSVEAQQVQSGEAMGFGITITAYVTAGRAADVWYSEFSA